MLLAQAELPIVSGDRGKRSVGVFQDRVTCCNVSAGCSKHCGLCEQPLFTVSHGTAPSVPGRPTAGVVLDRPHVGSFTALQMPLTQLVPAGHSVDVQGVAHTPAGVHTWGDVQSVLAVLGVHSVALGPV